MGTDIGRKEIISRENLTVMGISARYIAAYARIDKMFWWDKDMDCGPIVEQGTHFGMVRKTLPGSNLGSGSLPLLWWRSRFLDRSSACP